MNDSTGQSRTPIESAVIAMCKINNPGRGYCPCERQKRAVKDGGSWCKDALEILPVAISAYEMAMTQGSDK